MRVQPTVTTLVGRSGDGKLGLVNGPMLVSFFLLGVALAIRLRGCRHG